jgi:hypothetical protein
MSTVVVLHAFGQRYDLPASLALYLYAAAGVVVISFVMIVALASDRVGDGALVYPRRRSRPLTAAARSRLPRVLGGMVGVAGLLAIVVPGLFGSQNATRNPAEYLLFIYFWAGLVIVSGLVGNLWSLLNPWAAIYDAAARLLPAPRTVALPERIGIWPAVAGFFGFACLELTSGLASQPATVALLAVAYSLLTLAGMTLFGRDTWLHRGEAFTVLFDVIGRFSPVEAEMERDGPAVYLRPWGVGLLKSSPSGWDWTVFLILMLSTLAFDGVIATPAWQYFSGALEPYWLPLGQFGFFTVRTFGLLLLTCSFLLVFVAFIRLVVYLGMRDVERLPTLTAFALTLVPIALAYNAAHNYSYLVVQSQGLLPLLSDPLSRGWHLLPALEGVTPSFFLANAALVWYSQIVLIVLGHVIAVYLAHLRAGERFREARNVLLSQYPMLLLMVLYTMTSLWILAQPITREG